jgi:hypothetical protein
MAKLAAVTWDGMDTFKQELQLLTADLVSEAEGILISAAFDAADALRAAYPYREGGLVRGVTVIPSRGVTLAGAAVKNLAPTRSSTRTARRRARHPRGYNRGRMQGTPTFRPITRRYRDQALRPSSIGSMPTGPPRSRATRTPTKEQNMSIKTGKFGKVSWDPTGGTTLVEIISLNAWTLSEETEMEDVTCFGDTNKVYVPA